MRVSVGFLNELLHIQQQLCPPFEPQGSTAGFFESGDTVGRRVCFRRSLCAHGAGGWPMNPNIDHRQDLAGAVRTSLGIFANTVNAPLVPKPKKKTAERDTAEVANRKARFMLQRAAQGLLPGQRVAHCQRSTMSSAGVTVFRSAEGASYGNLSTCGSVWHCPVCSAKITESRRQELQGAINTWAKKGGEVYLMSLTFPHLDHQGLEANLKLFSDALKKFKNCRAYKNSMKAVGAPGSIRALEVTHGANGWHPHTHDLVFAEAGQLEKLRELQMVWIEMLIKVGIADRSQTNDMMRAAFDVQNGDYAAEYVAKFGHEATEASKIITENTWGASHEMTKAHAKIGKRLGGRTPFTLLADYIKGDVESGELFQEFGMHFKGKRQLFWSPKLRASLRLGDVERTDEEIAAEPLPDREFVTVLAHDEWKLVLSRNARFEVLRVAQDEGAEGVARLLEELAGRRRSHSGIYHERGHFGGNWHRLDA